MPIRTASEFKIRRTEIDMNPNEIKLKGFGLNKFLTKKQHLKIRKHTQTFYGPNLLQDLVNLENEKDRLMRIITEQDDHLDKKDIPSPINFNINSQDNQA